MILNSIILQAATQPSSDTIFSFWGMVITALATIVVALISSVITSKLNKPKTNAEITKIQAEEINLELDAMMKYQNLIEKLVEPLKKEISDLRQELEAMKPYICKRLNCPNRLKIISKE